MFFTETAILGVGAGVGATVIKGGSNLYGFIVGMGVGPDGVGGGVRSVGTAVAAAVFSSAVCTSASFVFGTDGAGVGTDVATTTHLPATFWTLPSSRVKIGSTMHN